MDHEGCLTMRCSRAIWRTKCLD